MPFLIRLLVNAAALWVATRIVTGVAYTGALLPLIGVALVFGIVNAIIRPILKFLTFPLFILTFGLFAFVLNGLMLLLTSAISSALGLGFHVSGFGDVRLHEESVTASGADVFDHLLAFRLTSSRHHDFCALLGEQDRAVFADAGCAARDDGNLIL